MAVPPEPGVGWTAAVFGAAAIAVGVLGLRKLVVPEGRAAPEPKGILWAIALLAASLAATFVLGAAAAILGLGGGTGAGSTKWPVTLLLGIDNAAKFAALVAVVILRQALRRGEPSGSPAPKGRALLAGAVCGVAIVPLMAAVQWLQFRVYEWIGRAPETQGLVEEAFRGSAVTALAVGAFAILLAPPWEEYLCRGLLYGGLRARIGFALSAAISAAVFAAMHFEPDAIPALFVLGLGLAAVRERTGGLTAPIAMHACYNAIQMAGIVAARAGG